MNNIFIFLSCLVISFNIYIFKDLKIYNVAMPNKNILKIRKDLDKLDDLFLNLIKKRTFS